MVVAGIANQLMGMQVYSVAARSMVFRDSHMRSAEDATRDYVSVASNCLLVKNAGPGRNLTILCDSGPGLHLSQQARAKLQIEATDVLTQNLANHGVSHDDIDVYLSSHLHWDHAGWAFNEGRFNLPNAQIVMSRQALQDNDRVDEKEEPDLSFLSDVPKIISDLQAQGRVTLLDALAYPLNGNGASLDWLGDGIRFYFSRGHSEGQMHATFSTSHGTIVFGGDFWPTAWHAQSTDRYMPRFDSRDTPSLLANKRAFLPQVVSGGWYLYFYHDPNTLTAQIQRSVDGYSLINQLGVVAWE